MKKGRWLFLEETKNNTKKLIIIFILLIISINTIIYLVYNNISSEVEKQADVELKLISSTENKDIDNIVKKMAKEEGIDLEIDYAGTLEIMDTLNSGAKYDAVWASNSIWLYMLDTNKVKLKNSKATCINPVVFGIKKSKAEDLGFIKKYITTRDIISAIEEKKLKFTMSSATRDKYWGNYVFRVLNGDCWKP